MTEVLQFEPALVRPLGAQPAKQRSLSILHVVQPAPVGGIESVIRALAVGHRSRGHAVHVLAVVPNDGRPHAFVDALRANGVLVTALAISGRGYARERAAVAALCREYHPDIVHTHGYRPDVVDGDVARRLGIPTVTTVHGLTSGSRFRGHLYLLLQALAHRRFDAVVSVSRVLADVLVRRGVRRNRLHVLPNGYLAAVPPLPRAVARARLGIHANARRVAWIGRLSHEKGPDVFVEAFARLSDRSVSASVIGDGPMRSMVRERAAALGLTDRITFHGVLSDAAQYHSAFDAMVLSSRSEGTPIALLEAMAAGTPVVATSVGGVPDVLRVTEGGLVPPDDPAALATAMDAVMSDPAASAELASRAQARVTDMFGASSWLDDYERLYRSLRRPPRTAEPALRSS